jgi:IS30 family transposase
MTYHHLSQEERYQISALLKAGLTQAQISVKLGRHKSTISREISRNSGLRGCRRRQACLLAENRAAITLENGSFPICYGKEFADHATIDRALGSTAYFANPYSSWQRGSNENLNGLVRQYIPKSRPLSTVTDAELEKIERLLNNRPRKPLGYKTPLEMFTGS